MAYAIATAPNTFVTLCYYGIVVCIAIMTTTAISVSYYTLYTRYLNAESSTQILQLKKEFASSTVFNIILLVCAILFTCSSVH